LRAHDVSVTVRLRAHDARTVHELVGTGSGVALLPRLMVDETDRATRALPVGDWLPPRRLAIYRVAARQQSAEAAVVQRAVVRAASACLA
jgi:DNA-binding transcriptional LysR family regulator